LSQVRQYVRIRFSKEGDIRFTSHHDLMRLFGRALRRSGLPVAVTEGYNPHLRISLPAALSVGIAGRNEVLDLELSAWVRPSWVRQKLSEQMPEGVQIKSVRITSSRPGRVPKKLSYRVPLLDGHCVTEGAVLGLLEGTEIRVRRERKGGTQLVDIRPFIKALRLEGEALYMLLDFSGKGTAHPEEVLGALGCQPCRDYIRSQIERTNVILSSSLP